MILFFFLSCKGENQSFGQVGRQQGKILAFSLSSVPFHAMWKPRNCIAFGGKKTPLVYLLHERRSCSISVNMYTVRGMSQNNRPLIPLHLRKKNTRKYTNSQVLPVAAIIWGL